MGYRHVQRSRTWLLAPALALVSGGVLIALVPRSEVVVPTVFVAALMFVVFVIFGRLTVTVDDTAVSAAFGWGWPRRTIRIADITSIRAVRNRWYHGWGIRLVANGWMFNVWGLDAVELELASGRVFRIGTDAPSELVVAIESRRAIVG